MKKGHIKVRIWPGYGFDIIGTDTSYILQLYTNTEPYPETIDLANGKELNPGDIITRLGGSKTSAGFSTIWFDEGKGLVYEGVLTSLDGEFLCFTQLKNGKRTMPKNDNAKAAYFAFINSKLKSREWIFTNHAGSGRLVETTDVEIRKE